MTSLPTIDTMQLELYETTRTIADSLLQQDSTHNWQLTDFIVETERLFPDDWLDFFVGGTYGKAQRTIEIMRLVGLRFPPKARAWDCAYGYYRELYAEKYPWHIVSELLENAANGEYKTRDDFRKHRNQLIGIEPTEKHWQSCKLGNIASVLSELGFDMHRSAEVRIRGNKITIEIVESE